MHVDLHAKELTSWCGGFCSIFLLVILLIYTTQKFDVLVNMRDVDLITMTETDALGIEDTFNST